MVRNGDLLRAGKTVNKHFTTLPMKDKLWERCAKDLLQLKPHWEETFRESFPISATSTLMLKLIVSSRKHFSLRLRVIVFDTAFPLKKLLYLYGPFPLYLLLVQEKCTLIE